VAKFVYKPTGAEPREWDFNPDLLPSYEAELIEEFTGWTYVEWWSHYRRGSMRAAHALLFMLLRRDEPTLQWGDVKFTIGEYDLEIEPEAVPKEDPAPEPSSDADTSSESAGT
jgi:hypothetical protein